MTNILLSHNVPPLTRDIFAVNLRSVRFGYVLLLLRPLHHLSCCSLCSSLLRLDLVSRAWSAASGWEEMRWSSKYDHLKELELTWNLHAAVCNYTIPIRLLPHPLPNCLSYDSARLCHEVLSRFCPVGFYKSVLKTASLHKVFTRIAATTLLLN